MFVHTETGRHIKVGLFLRTQPESQFKQWEFVGTAPIESNGWRNVLTGVIWRVSEQGNWPGAGGCNK